MKAISLSFIIGVFLAFSSSCANSQDNASEITVLNQELITRSDDHLVLKSVKTLKNEYCLSFEAYNTETVKHFSLNAITTDAPESPKLENIRLLKKKQLQPWQKQHFEIFVNSAATFLEIQNCSYKELDDDKSKAGEYSNLVLALTARGSENISQTVFDRKKVFYPFESNGVSVVTSENMTTKIKMPQNKKDKNRYALVVYNSYKNLLPINPAPWYIKNDAKLMKEFFEKVMGIPADNIEFAQLTSWNEMRNFFGSVCKRAELISGSNAEVYVYFTGLNLDINSSTFDLNTMVDNNALTGLKQTVFIFDTYNFNLIYNGTSINDSKSLNPSNSAAFAIISSRINTNYNSFPNKSKTNSIFVEKFIEIASKNSGYVRYHELENILKKVLPAEGLNLYPGKFEPIEPLFYYNVPRLKQRVIGSN